MHCPQCGQPFTNEVSFCKSCGLSLEGTKELFAPANRQHTAFKNWAKKRRRSRGRRGVYRGMVGVAIGIVFLLFLEGRNTEYPLVILTAGLLRIVFAMAFQEVISTKAESSVSTEDDLRVLPAQTAAGQLSSSHSVPVNDYYPVRMNTAEMAGFPSITEHTTNLLHLSDDDPIETV